MLIQRIRAGLQLLEPREFRALGGRCPFCGMTVLLRLRQGETGVRCLRCAAGPVHLSIGWALDRLQLDLGRLDTYELSSRGPLVDWLRRRSRSLQCSEYLDEVAPGSERDGVRCEDVQQLSFADASFDLITHTEVFEHVPDDGAGLRQLYRVLRPGGHMVFTVPLSAAPLTVERARLGPAGLEYLLEPTYHTDLLRGERRVLCFRDYGQDIVARVRAAGFAAVELLSPDHRIPWSAGRHVLCAHKMALPVRQVQAILD